ncbi:MAG: 4-phosphoerythronate dehydrogenase [Muribaculaceae bacterium]|nr:4-phosphoerythronate dehydrogenase [Muribaculaceae bacterium]
MKKVIVESHVPFVADALRGHAVVESVPPEAITPAVVRDADAVVVRTRTRCDAALLEGSRVSIVATATIGTDHIDREWCAAHGIAVASAPGCNAPAVAQWVMGAMRQVRSTKYEVQSTNNEQRKTVGVVGVGHVGSIVARWAADLGMDVLLCDPPRARREGDDGFVTFDEVLERADVITLHVPLSHTGADATRHLINRETLARARRCRLLLNAARGAVCDTAALLEAPSSLALAIDCWEDEPRLSLPLLERAMVATPHIAGYSLEGKQRGAAMVLEALETHFGLNLDIAWPDVPATGIEHLTWDALGYDPLADTAALKSQPAAFETLRNTYTLRHEPHLFY